MKFYYITGNTGTRYKLTAKQLCLRIIEDSKSDFNWIAPARELIRVCKAPDFPEEYSVIIKTAILNCFANIEERANHGGDRYCIDSEDKKAVYYSYNSLFGSDDEDVIAARKRYLEQMIIRSTYYCSRYMPLHYGKTFVKVRNEWNKTKFDSLLNEEFIDFESLLYEFHSSFIEFVDISDKAGVFEEDKKRYEQRMKAICKHLKDLH